MKYPIHGTILRIVFNLLTTKFFGGFSCKKTNRSLKMKSKILITGAIFCAITTTGAHAVTKCVALNGSNTTCTSASGTQTGSPEWTATCATNGVSTPISGIGACSSTSGRTIGQTATAITTTSSGSNLYCWCKMTSPAVSSRWVYYAQFASTDSCAWGCAQGCADYLEEYASFRTGLFGLLSD